GRERGVQPHSMGGGANGCPREPPDRSAAGGGLRRADDTDHERGGRRIICDRSRALGDAQRYCSAEVVARAPPNTVTVRQLTTSAEENARCEASDRSEEHTSELQSP